MLSGISSANAWDSTYDKAIKSAAETYWPGVPWKLWKAQLYQESRLDPRAKSPVGARGIAQFMPATWAEVAKELAITDADPTNPDQAIVAGAYYMMEQRLFWGKALDPDRHKLAAASYNAGAGNIRKAWRICNETYTWVATQPCLVQVTGRHSVETTTYIQRIWKYWTAMELS